MITGPLYTAKIATETDGITTVELGFGEPATNAEIVPAAIDALSLLRLPGGKGIRFNGAASIPVVSALTHAVVHLYGFVAWFDPKLQRYVVAVSHDPAVKPGDLLGR